MRDKIPVHPIQMPRRLDRIPAVVPQVVTLKAYEVYCHLYSEQKALIEGDCRGGFGLEELIVFLYAHNFPKEEWRKRVAEAEEGMNLKGYD